MSLDNFLATMADAGFAETSKFLIEINPPKKMLELAGMSQLASSDNMQFMSLYCNKASFPEIQTNVGERVTFGPTKPIATSRIAPLPINLKFYIDKDMDLKRFWDAWMEIIYPVKNTSQTKWLHAYPDDYTSSGISISQLDKSGFVVYKVRLFDAFPSIINDISLDAQAGGTLSELNVTLRYRYWQEIPVVEQPEVKKKDDRGILGQIGSAVSNALRSVDQVINQGKKALESVTSFRF